MHRSSLRLWILAAAVLTTAFAAAPAGHRRAEEVQITVLAILATDKNNDVDPRLKQVAERVRKLRPALTGFRLAKITCTSVEAGKEYQFKLVDDVKVLVTVEHGADKKNRIGLTVKPPQLGTITYNCCCGKYLPIWTDYQTAAKESLFIAIMVKPCAAGCDE